MVLCIAFVNRRKHQPRQEPYRENKEEHGTYKNRKCVHCLYRYLVFLEDFSSFTRPARRPMGLISFQHGIYSVINSPCYSNGNTYRLDTLSVSSISRHSSAEVTRGASSVGSIGRRMWPIVEGCGARYESHATPDTEPQTWLRVVEALNTNTTFVFPTFNSDTNTTTQTSSQFLVHSNEQ